MSLWGDLGLAQTVEQSDLQGGIGDREKLLSLCCSPSRTTFINFLTVSPYFLSQLMGIFCLSVGLIAAGLFV